MAGREFPLKVVITGIDKISAPMQRMTAGLKRLTAPLMPVRNSLAGLRNESLALSRAAGFDVLREQLGEVTTAMSRLGTAGQATFRRLGGLAIGAGGLAFAFKRQLIDNSAAFESLQVRLEGIEGSADKAKRSFEFIKGLSMQSPFDISAIADTFTMMKGFGMDPTNGALQAIIDQTAKLGRPSESLTHIAMQLGQAWSKARLNAEDANILAENGIPVWDLLGRAIERVSGKKLTVPQLREASEQGRIGRKELAAFIEQIGIEAAGSALRMAQTWIGLTNQISTRWKLFRLQVMDSGPFRLLTEHLKRILGQIDLMAKDGRLKIWAEAIGAKLMTGFRWLEREGPPILTQVWGNLQTIFTKADSIAKVFGGWGNLITTGVAAYIAGPLVASVVSLAAAIASLNFALIGTPAGLLLLGGAALLGAGAFVAWKSISMPGGSGGIGGPIGGTSTDLFKQIASLRPPEVFRGVTLAPSGSPVMSQQPLSAAERAATLRLAPDDVAALAKAIRQSQDTNITVDVKAPPGTSVRTSGSASIEVRRHFNTAFAQ